MKKLCYVIAIALLFQSCQTLKPVSVSETKIGNKYVLNLKTGATIEGRLEKVMADTLVFNINDNQIKLPKNRIENINKVKIKTTALIFGSVITIGGIVILVNGFPENKESISIL